MFSDVLPATRVQPWLSTRGRRDPCKKASRLGLQHPPDCPPFIWLLPFSRLTLCWCWLYPRMLLSFLFSASFFLGGFELRALCLLGKHSATWATSSAPGCSFLGYPLLAHTESLVLCLSGSSDVHWRAVPMRPIRMVNSFEKNLHIIKHFCILRVNVT
jgi:hypothetical protein